jgi:hypothetical protein
VPRLRHEYALQQQRVHELHQEQRVPIRAPVQRLDHGRGYRRTRQARRDIRCHGRRREPLQRQLYTLAVQGQGRLQGLEGMLVHDHLHRAIRAQQQQPGRRPPLGQVRHQGQGGMVAPVQVFEH